MHIVTVVPLCVLYGRAVYDDWVTDSWATRHLGKRRFCDTSGTIDWHH